MGEWYPDESEAVSKSIPKVDKEYKLPCKRKAPLSLSFNRTKKKPLHVVTANVDDSHQFMPPYSDKELQHLAEGLKPAKTEASTQWAIKNFMKWAQNRK